MLQAYLNANVPIFNTMVASLIQQYPTTHPGATVLPYDVNALFNNVTSNLAAYGFTNAMDPAYQGPSFFEDITGGFEFSVVANPSSYLFWDNAEYLGFPHAVHSSYALCQRTLRL